MHLTCDMRFVHTKPASFFYIKNQTSVCLFLVFDAKKPTSYLYSFLLEFSVGRHLWVPTDRVGSKHKKVSCTVFCTECTWHPIEHWALLLINREKKTHRACNLKNCVVLEWTDWPIFEFANNKNSAPIACVCALLCSAITLQALLSLLVANLLHLPFTMIESLSEGWHTYCILWWKCVYKMAVLFNWIIKTLKKRLQKLPLNLTL